VRRRGDGVVTGGCYNIAMIAQAAFLCTYFGRLGGELNRLRYQPRASSLFPLEVA